ncbi:hypothetical protein OJE16_18925 [Pantoea tagorei]
MSRLGDLIKQMNNLGIGGHKKTEGPEDKHLIGARKLLPYFVDIKPDIFIAKVKIGMLLVNDNISFFPGSRARSLLSS